MRGKSIGQWTVAVSLCFSMILPANAQESRDPSIHWIFGGQELFHPSGSILADSGFRPYPDGFGFFNFGDNLRLNQLLFAQPRALLAGRPSAKPESLRPSDMRNLFGPEVCVGNNATGTCAHLQQSNRFESNE